MELQASLRKANLLAKVPEVSRTKVRGAIVGTNFELGSIRSKFNKDQPPEPKSRPKSGVNPKPNNTSEGPASLIRRRNPTPEGISTLIPLQGTLTNPSLEDASSATLPGLRGINQRFENPLKASSY
jgi:hypothetical protein